MKSSKTATVIATFLGLSGLALRIGNPTGPEGLGWR